MSLIDCIACCTRCGERAWIEDGTIEIDHDCPAAGRPCEVESCDLCDGTGIMDKRHAGPCGHFCGCMECERCERTTWIATPIQGPALPRDPEHPFNTTLWKGGPQRPAPNAAVDELQAARILNDLAIDEHGNLIPTYATPWNNPRE